jgi:DNA-binding IscR family transcriptional regulator
MRMLYYLHIMHYICKKFKSGEKAPSITQLSAKLDIPASLIRNILDNCIKSGLVVESVTDTKNKEGLFSPAMDLSMLTMGFIIQKIEGLGELRRSEITAQEFQLIKQYYNDMEEAMFASPSNKNIADL